MKSLSTKAQLFLFMGIPFGLFMGIYFGYQGGVKMGLFTGLASGLLYGGLMALILVQIQSKVTGTNQRVNVHQTRKVELPLPFETAFDSCLNSIQTLSKPKVQQSDKAIGLIEVMTGITWKSWGDKVSIRVERIGDDRSLVTVESRPRVQKTLIDYGQNRANVERIVQQLKAD